MAGISYRPAATAATAMLTTITGMAAVDGCRLSRRSAGKVIQPR